ncbi:ATP-binding protein [Streptomyces sp. TRM 70361]|uniref:ATP-binding protein n=1 Tax=Streptomyces sp. TRM 70361 TaxID=3116553 RepID=UPI002E7B7653|nr:ATP-binding protein [Streptomyces sp. TRM 70361]MEE1938659.1 ATP-binding protein [Streptomyces sp. TRM 70361]
MTALPIPAPSPIPFDHPWEYELRFPRDPRGPGIARATLRTVLAAHGLRDLTPRAELLTSELATNSVRHTGRAAAVRLQWLCPVLRVSVWDADPEVPSPVSPPPPPDGEGGRGLLILDVLADRWGGGPRGTCGLRGKAVWFELTWDVPPPAPVTVT